MSLPFSLCIYNAYIYIFYVLSSATAVTVHQQNQATSSPVISIGVLDLNEPTWPGVFSGQNPHRCDLWLDGDTPLRSGAPFNSGLRGRLNLEQLAAPGYDENQLETGWNANEI